MNRLIRWWLNRRWDNRRTMRVAEETRLRLLHERLHRERAEEWERERGRT